MKRKRWLLIAILIVLGTGLTISVQAADYDPWGWSKKNLDTGWMEWEEKYWPSKPVRGGYYRTASAKYIGMMNPNHWPVNDWSAIGRFYEGITAYDGEYRQTVTWLMESFEYTSPTVLIMKLKRGVKFHDGSDFNARSLKYLFDWIGDKKNGCWTRGQQRRIKSLEVVDEYTLRWTTHKPWGSFPQGFFAFQISAEALKGDIAIREAKKARKKIKSVRKKHGKAKSKYEKVAGNGGKAEKKAAKKLKKIEAALAKAERFLKETDEKAKGRKSTDVFPVGTGQYMFEEARPGNYLKLKRNPNWWFGRTIGRPEMPYFDGLKIIVIPDPAIQLANLRAGKIDTMYLSKAQYQMVKNDRKLRVHTSPNNFTTVINFNQAKGPCGDIRIRQAVTHALDRKALIAGTQFGLARIASSMCPFDHWGHNPDLEPLSYDPELSKKLLAEAGYPNGITLRGLNYNYADSMTLGDAVKNMLANVGIDLQTSVLEPASMRDRLRNLEYDLAISAQPYIQDPDANLSNSYHPDGGFHDGRNDNPKLIALIEEGRYEIDPIKRQKIYHRIEKELYDNYMDVFLFWDINAIAHRKKVNGWNSDMFVKYRTLYTASHPLWFEDGRP
ncbi:MAG: ABC transporter substrate-binding protein [Proteobacteria bacterium]|nr:ABC transporter substrate-binding protein [Pseudomonadota bacterium]